MTKYQYEQKQNKQVFFKKIQLTISCSIILAFLIVGSIIYYRQYSDFKYQLESQGKVLSANLAYNSERFIIEYDKNQLNDLLDGVLKNTYVLFTGIINSRISEPAIDVLKKQSFVDLEFVAELVRQPSYSTIKAPKSILIKGTNNIGDVIFCISPILSELEFPDDETTLLFGQKKNISVIGHSVIAYKMPWDQILSIQYKWFFLVYFFASLLLGWLIGAMITKYWTGRLKLIHYALSNYSFGDVISIKDEINDEVSTISESISGLTEMVNVQIDKIQSINKKLDITVNKQFEELESLKNKADRNNLFQRTFIAQIIQELKLLLEFSRDPQMINNQFNYFYDHINQLIDLSIRIARKKNDYKFPIKLYLVSLNQIMNELQPVFEIMASKNSNTIKFNINGNLLFISDEIQLTQSIIQLIGNACKYTESGNITVDIYKDDHNITFKIIDTGIGVDQKEVDQIFQTLKDANIGSLKAFSNLGFGLLLVYQFMNEVGGSIECKSEKGKGTEIYLKHPILKEPVSNIESKQIICFTKSLETIRNWRFSIHKAGWEAIHIKSVKNTYYFNTNVCLIDIDTITDIYLFFKELRKVNKSKTCILVSENKGILCSDILLRNDLDNIKNICSQILLNKNNPTIFLDGLTGSMVEKMTLALNYSNVIDKFSALKNIDLQIVIDEKYKLKHNRKQLILFNKEENIKELISIKGEPVNNLIKLIVS